MFSFFKSSSQPDPSTLSRFESCLELQPIFIIINKLRDKEVALRESGSEKHTVIAYLLSELDKSINLFNAINVDDYSKHSDHIPDMLELIKNLQGTTSQVINVDRDTLAIKRNSNRELAQVATYIGPEILACGVVMFGLVTGPAGLLLISGAFLSSAALGHVTGIDSNAADSVRLIDELQDTLECKRESLESLSVNYVSSLRHSA